jgi:hypothetical protein
MKLPSHFVGHQSQPHLSFAGTSRLRRRNRCDANRNIAGRK